MQRCTASCAVTRARLPASAKPAPPTRRAPTPCCAALTATLCRPRTARTAEARPFACRWLLGTWHCGWACVPLRRHQAAAAGRGGRAAPGVAPLAAKVPSAGAFAAQASCAHSRPLPRRASRLRAAPNPIKGALLCAATPRRARARASGAQRPLGCARAPLCSPSTLAAAVQSFAPLSAWALRHEMRICARRRGAALLRGAACAVPTRCRKAAPPAPSLHRRAPAALRAILQITRSSDLELTTRCTLARHRKRSVLRLPAWAQARPSRHRAAMSSPLRSSAPPRGTMQPCDARRTARADACTPQAPR